MSKPMSEEKRAELQSSLKRSAARRKAIVGKFGFMPMSIIRMGRGELSHRMFVFQSEREGRGGSVAAGSFVGPAGKYGGPADRRVRVRDRHDKLNAERRAEFGNVALSPYSSAAGRLVASIMPAELVDFFVKYYAKPGDVYLDPFMGQGVQMQVAKLRGLDYRGYDLSAEFFAYIESVKAKIDDGKTELQIVLGDSRHPDEIPDGIGDFSFHSPPYWDIEYYGDEPEQLGQGTYEDFLDSMREVYAAWLPKFKPGAWHVVNVNDFRRDKKFIPYHADTIRVAVEAGWVLHDTWIIDGLVGGVAKAFAVDKNMSHIAPKVHEFAIVFKAPDAPKRRRRRRVRK